MLKIIIICVGIIIIIGIVIEKDPSYLLAGLGASAAVFMLVFKDSIMGLVAGVQLSANDMLRPGDWITMEKYGADGMVQDVSLTTVKVQNWDKTITTIPPYALVSDSFQNWRGMFDSGGRRIKRSINIDMNTIAFFGEEQLEQLAKKNLYHGESKGKKVVNLTLFREWLENWLKEHPQVNKEMITMVRQLQPTTQGMPLELYFFFNGTAWVMYEHLQSEIFEYVLATLPEFGLKTFQSPTGGDLMALKA
jgi:miniconductance mechanosensitive channel